MFYVNDVCEWELIFKILFYVYVILAYCLFICCDVIVFEIKFYLL